MPPTTEKPKAGAAAPDAKSDPRHPDTVADKTGSSPASPTDLDPGDSSTELNDRFGIRTIDTSEVDHSAGETVAPVRYPAINSANSTFADRRAAREKRQTTAVDPDTVTSK